MARAQLAQKVRTGVARRSMASTMPGDPASSAQAWLSDQPSWCVDLGPRLLAMSTCDLWLALAKGEVAPATKVWREGMAYWEPVVRVPEFALALPDASLWSSPPGRVSAVTTSASNDGDGGAEAGMELGAEAFGAAASAGNELAHEDDRTAVGVVTFAPPGDFSTPAPMVVEHEEPPPTSQARPRWFPQIDRRGAASVVTGAVLAIAALAIATTGPMQQADPSSAGTQPAAARGLEDIRFVAPLPPRETQTMQETQTVQGARAAEPAPPLGTTSAAPARSVHNGHGRVPAALQPPKPRTPRGPRAADRGQQRSRSGTP